MKAKAIFLAVFLGIGGMISYDQMTNSDNTYDVAVVGEEPNVYAVNSEAEAVELMSYFYAVETHDKVLVPLVYVSEVITEDDIDQFIVLSETVLPQMNYDEIEDGLDIVMTHANRNREYPVFIEVIRVSE